MAGFPGGIFRSPISISFQEWIFGQCFNPQFRLLCIPPLFPLQILNPSTLKCCLICAYQSSGTIGLTQFWSYSQQIQHPSSSPCSPPNIGSFDATCDSHRKFTDGSTHSGQFVWYDVGISSPQRKEHDLQGEKYCRAIIPPPGTLFACRSRKAYSQKPGLSLRGASVLYGGGGSSVIVGTEVRSTSIILVDMFVAPLRKALGGMDKVVIRADGGRKPWSRGVVKLKGQWNLCARKCNENQNCKTRKGSQRKCEITDTSDD
ncbi:hypothetical protein BGZ57DRAFT_900977, partial [Hyaloscypha finlandica]